MTTEVKEFIEKNIDLIEENKFEEFYTNVSSDIFGNIAQGEVTQVLWEADIHPEKELIDIPNSFAYNCSIPMVIDAAYNHVRVFSSFSFNGSSVISIDLSNSKCESIGFTAFQGCEKLIWVKLPAKLLSIDHYAFSGCYNLKSINIPSQVTELIGTFNECIHLTDVTFEGTKQQFKAIKKDSMWRKGSGIKEIICSDGVLRFK